MSEPVADGSTTEQGWDVRPRWVVHDFGHRQGGEGGNTKFVTLNEAEDALHHARHQAEERMQYLEASRQNIASAFQAERQRVQQLEQRVEELTTAVRTLRWNALNGYNEDSPILVNRDGWNALQKALRDQPTH